MSIVIVFFERFSWLLIIRGIVIVFVYMIRMCCRLSMISFFGDNMWLILLVGWFCLEDEGSWEFMVFISVFFFVR